MCVINTSTASVKVIPQTKVSKSIFIVMASSFLGRNTPLFCKSKGCSRDCHFPQLKCVLYGNKMIPDKGCMTEGACSTDSKDSHQTLGTPREHSIRLFHEIQDQKSYILSSSAYFPCFYKTCKGSAHSSRKDWQLPAITVKAVISLGKWDSREQS